MKILRGEDRRKAYIEILGPQIEFHETLADGEGVKIAESEVQEAEEQDFGPCTSVYSGISSRTEDGRRCVYGSVCGAIFEWEVELGGKEQAKNGS